MAIFPSDLNPFSQKEWSLGDWRVQPQLHTLVRGDHRMRITPKAMAVLATLAQARGVVSREQLRARVWQDEYLTDDVLTHAISSLRKALGDSPRQPIYIQTIPKKGYRLLVPASFENPSSPISAENHLPERRPANQHRPGVPTSKTVKGSWLAWGIPLGLLVLLLVGWKWHFVRVTPVKPTASLSNRALPLTSMPGSEEMPDFSPDGQKIVFSHEGDLWIKLIQSADELQVTATRENDRFPRWHPNGREIIFTRYTEHDAHIMAVPSVGGAARQLVRCRANSYVTLAVHPTGRWLAYSATESSLGGQIIYLLNLETLEKYKFTHLPPQHHYSGDSFPAFSPSGKQLAFARSKLGSRSIFLQDLPAWVGGSGALEPAEKSSWDPNSWLAPRQLLGFDQDIFGITWHPDGVHLIYAGGFPTHTQLMALKIPPPTRVADSGKTNPGGGTFSEPIPITVSSPNPISPVMGPSGLAFVDSRTEQNIWEYRLDPRAPEPLQGKPFLSSTRQDFNPAFSPGGDRIAFASTRSGTTQIWVCNSSGKQLRQLTHMKGPFAVLPVWSHDGTQISFTANTNQQLDIHTVMVATGQVRALLTSQAQEASSSWSPQGQWLYFSTDRGASFDIWKMPIGGGEAERLLTNAFVPRLLPNDDWLYFVHFQKGGIWRKHLAGEAVEQVVEDLVLQDWNHWDLTEQGLYFMIRQPNGAAHIHFRDHQTGTTVDLGQIHGVLDYEVAGLSVYESPNLTRILIPQIDVNESDILLIKDFRLAP